MVEPICDGSKCQKASVRELAKAPTDQQPKQAALFKNLNKQVAERTSVYILFLSLRSARRKNLTVKYPYMPLATSTDNEQIVK